MWWWIVPLAFILLLLGYLLFARLVIDIDSTTGLIQFRFDRLVCVNLLLNESAQVLRVRVAWWTKEYPLFEPGKKAGPEKPQPAAQKKKVRRRRKRMPAKKMFRKIKAVLLSFRIRTCTVSIDTGNMPLNGILYPWFYLLKCRTGKNIEINFWGENTVILQIENSFARMLWAYIKS